MPAYYVGRRLLSGRAALVERREGGDRRALGQGERWLEEYDWGAINTGSRRLALELLQEANRGRVPPAMAQDFEVDVLVRLRFLGWELGEAALRDYIQRWEAVHALDAGADPEG